MAKWKFGDVDDNKKKYKGTASHHIQRRISEVLQMFSTNLYRNC